MPILAGYFGALVAFVAFDMVWLSVMVERIYRPAIGPLLAETVNLPAAGIFYLLAPVGVTYFAVLPALKAQSVSVALVSGALYGFFSYMTYDLTNQATLKSWSTEPLHRRHRLGRGVGRDRSVRRLFSREPLSSPIAWEKIPASWPYSAQTLLPRVAAILSSSGGTPEA